MCVWGGGEPKQKVTQAFIASESARLLCSWRKEENFDDRMNISSLLLLLLQCPHFPTLERPPSSHTNHQLSPWQHLRLWVVAKKTTETFPLVSLASPTTHAQGSSPSSCSLSLSLSLPSLIIRCLMSMVKLLQPVDSLSYGHGSRHQTTTIIISHSFLHSFHQLP